MAKVDMIPIAGCWVWTGAENQKGYGIFRMPNGSTSAYRAAWTLLVGDIPAGICVCHRCDTPACVNPHHLFVGTKGDNNQDRDSKGRSRGPKGAANRTSVLTESDVRNLREIYALGIHSQRELGIMYGITQGA